MIMSTKHWLTGEDIYTRKAALSALVKTKVALGAILN